MNVLPILQNKIKFQNTKDYQNFPLIRDTEKSSRLSKYFQVLNRSESIGIKMEDLNDLQSDLENLLSTCVLRERTLLPKLNQSHRNLSTENCVQNHDKQLKVNPTNNVIAKTGHSKVMKQLTSSEVQRQHYITPRAFSSRYTYNNDVCAAFWAFTEPYFAPVTRHDFGFLDNLVKDSTREICYRKSKKDKRCMKMCPWFKQDDPNKENYCKLRLNGQVGSKRDEISKEINKLSAELINIRQKNINGLNKLKSEVLKQLYR